jgi:hypothetical protein
MNDKIEFAEVYEEEELTEEALAELSDNEGDDE